MTFERTFSSILCTGIFSHPNEFAYGHVNSIDRQRHDNRFHIEMVFHLYVFEHDLVKAMDEKMLCHKFYIYRVMYVFGYASLMLLMNCKFSHRIYIEIVF